MRSHEAPVPNGKRVVAGVCLFGGDHLCIDEFGGAWAVEHTGGDDVFLNEFWIVLS